tara:strand:- start:117 stop:566 length:450 start_codon:yes stop_codon:yes gene_type:complete
MTTNYVLIGFFFLLIIIIIVLSISYHTKETTCPSPTCSSDIVYGKIDENIHKKLDAILEQLFKMFKKNINMFLPSMGNMEENKKLLIENINAVFAMYEGNDSEEKVNFINELNKYCETGDDKYFKNAIETVKNKFERRYIVRKKFFHEI